MVAWTDSTVVLAWLRKPSRNWQTFVANRVSEIQATIAPGNWFHVPGTENPADCASRGMPAESLREFILWWAGPSWLKSDESCWPKSMMEITTNLDAKIAVVSLITTVPAYFETLDRFSSLPSPSQKSRRLYFAICW